MLLEGFKIDMTFVRHVAEMISIPKVSDLLGLLAVVQIVIEWNSPPRNLGYLLRF